MKEFARRATGSTRFTLSIKNFNEIEVLFPPLEEQQRIAQILMLADDEIIKLKNELVFLKTQKKGLMQQLLTGKIRVKT
ncbi:restriction endonuclease subunit S [Bathymodiolus thermophilus thioautotrophic gill symbiont]|uniref:restriction endonuclease subunit S n=1 Tax=Bathymodiolus thermophilus thioautotrophic gill symbiont TaxID=2360 RepID=UPI0013DFF724|nr:restriction endonuclease subunit S [Bathymodiolus thermophilus thioautotrophic gill symbiont]